ncbi:MAG: hypothetical protein NTZ33_08160 [Bacteroidetes bacterium]|nr:hypothetical protein [Bacteroidota bacterium]
MTKKLIILILAIISIIGCDNNKEIDKAASKNAKEKEVQQKINKSTDKKTNQIRIGDYMSDTSDFFWYAKQSDTASYWIRIVFQKEFAVYQFHGQCIYWFFTNHYYTKADKIELLWSYKSDCLLTMDFLRKSNGVKKFPKAGDAFCEYSLLNDTVIVVKYNFPEWTEKINKMEKDSIFPKYLYLKKSGI